MNQSEKKYLIEALKVLLKIDDINVMKYTIESLLEKIEEDESEDDKDRK